MKYSRSILALLAGLLIIFNSCDVSNKQADEQYHVSISVIPAKGGVVTPKNGKYDEGEKIEFSATPADNSWKFDGWSGDFESTNASPTIIITKPMNIKANFTKISYRLTIHTEGEGTVEQKVVENKTSSSANYDSGTVVTLTAKPADGWTFVKWKGDLTGTKNSAQITVKEPKTVTAVFQKKAYALTVNTEGQGTVNQKVVTTKFSSSANYDYGTVVVLTVKPATGWTFVKWKGDLTGTKNPARITVKEPKAVTAVFQKKTFALTVKVTGQGSVTKSSNQNEYDYNTKITLTAKPATGWKFVKWQGDVTSTSQTIKVTIDKPKTVTAVFQKKGYVLTVKVNGKGSVTKSPNQNEYAYNTKVTVTAKPATGWTFVKWQGDVTSTSQTVKVTMNKAKAVTAVFKSKKYDLTVNTEGQGAVHQPAINQAQNCNN